MTELRLFVILLASLSLGVAFGVQAKTPDGEPPSEETVCDDYTGALFGLCNAYCEAMDCTDPNQRASERGCSRVLENFIVRSDGDLPPCAASCPCFDSAEIDATIAPEDAVCEEGIITSISAGDDDDFLTGDLEGFFCVDEFADPDQLFLGISEAQQQDCVDQILNSAAGAACPSNEP